MSRILTLLALLLLPVAAHAQLVQCPAGAPSGTIGCQPAAATALPTDQFLTWQVGQTPHTRSTPIGSAAVAAAGSSAYNSLSTWMSYLAGTGIDPYGMASYSYNIGVTGYPTNTYTTNITGAYHTNWPVVQSTVPNNPTEWQVYPNASLGIATTVNGTNQIVALANNSMPFQSSWIGLPYFYFEGVLYKVATVTDTSHLTVTTPTGGAVTFGSNLRGTWYFSTTSTTSVCNVAGTTVTYVSGQPFIGGADQTYINGSLVTATFVNQTEFTIASPLTLTAATCVQYESINDELSTLRLQGLWGSNEENFSIQMTPAGTIMGAQYSGYGKYRPLWIRNGENPAGTSESAISIYPSPTIGMPGPILIGGDFNTNDEVAQFIPNYNNVNFLYFSGGPPGFAPSMAVRGTDSSVGMGFDVQGDNSFSFTSHTFGNNEFQIYGNGLADYIAVSSGSGIGNIQAEGTDTNVSINLVPKGAGTIQVGGVAGVSCAANTVSLTTMVVTNGIVTHC